MPSLNEWREVIRAYANQGVALRGQSGSDAALEIPVHLGDYNIVWPVTFTREDRRYWRAMMEMPGLELTSFNGAGGRVPFTKWYSHIEAAQRKRARWKIIRQYIIWLLVLWR